MGLTYPVTGARDPLSGRMVERKREIVESAHYGAPIITIAYENPGVFTASWEVTGVLYRGGVIKLPRARSARVFCPPQARKFGRW